jgi:enoyl-[acyl-carrier protein] reductase I
MIVAIHEDVDENCQTAIMEDDTMGLLDGKKALVLGVANDHSIAWGIAKALHAEGAELGFNYLGEALERRVRPLAASVDAKLVEPCNLNSDEEIAALVEKVKETFGTIDIIIHAVAFANKEHLNGPYMKVDRAGFLTAMEVSVYSLTAIAKAAESILNPGGSILTLTYHGAQQVIQNYNVMGVAKAALEASVRYLASDLGPRNIRVNAISAGPIRTLSASGIADFRALHKQFADIAPLRRNVTTDDIGKTAVWLCSDWASGVTSEVIYVDAGFHNVSVSLQD